MIGVYARSATCYGSQASYDESDIGLLLGCLLLCARSLGTCREHRGRFCPWFRSMSALCLDGLARDAYERSQESKRRIALIVRRSLKLRDGSVSSSDHARYGTDERVLAPIYNQQHDGEELLSSSSQRRLHSHRIGQRAMTSRILPSLKADSNLSCQCQLSILRWCGPQDPDIRWPDL